MLLYIWYADSSEWLEHIVGVVDFSSNFRQSDRLSDRKILVKFVTLKFDLTYALTQFGNLMKGNLTRSDR